MENKAKKMIAAGDGDTVREMIAASNRAIATGSCESQALAGLGMAFTLLALPRLTDDEAVEKAFGGARPTRPQDGFGRPVRGVSPVAS
jgi:hypothetical protein